MVLSKTCRELEIKKMNNKDILITGGSGSIGTALCEYIFKKYSVNNINILTNSGTEKKIFDKLYKDEPYEFYISDIRNFNKINNIIKDNDIVIHMAAFKLAPEAERMKDEVFDINIIGTHNILKSCKQNNIDKCIFISTDKAVNPVGFYGKTKRIGEILTMTYGYTTVRFGNILNTSNSVIPIISNQIKQNKPITITDRRMTRFYMSLRDSSSFITKAIKISNGGEIIIRNMPSIKTGTLIDTIVKHKANYIPKYSNINIRIGEKYHEELYYDFEKNHMKKYNNDIYIIDYNETCNDLFPTKLILNEKDTEIYLHNKGII